MIWAVQKKMKKKRRRIQSLGIRQHADEEEEEEEEASYQEKIAILLAMSVYFRQPTGPNKGSAKNKACPDYKYDLITRDSINNNNY